MNFKRESNVMNVMEPIVGNMFEDRFVRPGLLECACDKCQLDIVLLTLNHLPPHYTSSQAGEAYIKAIYQETQLQSDVLREITNAVKVIQDKPNH
ncbi:late competence development ComFB family protein [Cohnella panacarvi]|uniref:late competence development ComFB family protein n=1 Tax=Cohnella panacarvi TaxID=400776 RepID=UPI00047E231C|nr:late competence development ComFB family protein [Cohnella panacarvi]